MIHRKLVNVQAASEGSRKRVFGKIIFGRANPAREYNHIRTAAGNFDGLLKAAAVIPNDGLKEHINSKRRQLQG
ncbi:hypothetical protein D3C86_2072900 [compost metagenome]